MHKGIDYCTYEMSVMLKDLGYKESSMWWYNTVIDYPEDGGEIEIQQLVKGNRWMDYDSWDECPKDFLICPMLYDAYSFLIQKFEWSPKPIYSDGVQWEYNFGGTIFSATTFKNAFKSQVEHAVRFFWAIN